LSQQKRIKREKGRAGESKEGRKLCGPARGLIAAGAPDHDAHSGKRMSHVRVGAKKGRQGLKEKVIKLSAGPWGATNNFETKKKPGFEGGKVPKA